MVLGASRRRFLSICAALSLLSEADADGSIQEVAWSTTVDGFRPATAHRTDDGTVVFAGSKAVEHEYDDGTAVAYDGFAIEVSEAGDVEWSETYFDPDVRDRGRISNMDFHFSFSDIVPSGDGGFLCVGRYVDTNYGYSLGWIAKIAADGAFEWDRYFAPEQGDGVDDVFGNCILRAGTSTAEGYLVVGSADRGDSVDDPSYGYLAELDGDGNKRHEAFGPDDVSFSSVIDWGNGGVLLCPRGGHQLYRHERPVEEWDPAERVRLPTPASSLRAFPTGVLAIGSDSHAGAVARLDTDFEPLWEHVYSPWDDDIGFSDAIPTGGGWLLTGPSRQAAEAWVLTVGESGAKLSERSYREFDGGFRAGARTSDGDYLLAGDDDEFDGTGWIVRLGGAGNGDGDDWHTLQVTKDGSEEGVAAHAVSVSGALEPGEESDAVLEGASAIDWVGPETGTDTVRFTGAVTEFLLKGQATVSLDGERVDPGELGKGNGSDTGEDLPNTLTVTKEDAPEGVCAFLVTVSGAIEVTEESEAVVEGASAVDWVGPEGGSDTLGFSGEITKFLLKGAGTVYLNGDRVDPDEL